MCIRDRVKLKIDHTYRVAALCARIAQSLALPPEDVDLAWLSGILHDVGRFEQLRRYNTFIEDVYKRQVQLVPDGGKRGGGVWVIGFKIQQPPQPALLVHDAQALGIAQLKHLSLIHICPTGQCTG